MKRSERQPSSESGATILEVAITIVAFLLVVITGIELMRLAYVTLATQIVAVEAARFTSLGTCQGGNCSTPSGRADFYESAIAEYARGVGLSITENNICIRPASAPNCNANNDDDNPGGPREFVFITISRDVFFVLGSAHYTVRAQAVVRNEPFGAAVL